MKKQWIVVVDDDAISLKIANELLSSDQMKISSVRSGRELLIFLQKNSPDLILLDVVMPEMDGLDATRIIKEVNQDVPIIALSAFAFPENIREAKAAGCNDFMAKPFKVEDLIEIIKHYIGS